ncbi:Lipopolysaccharide core [Carex littledalei]|uniref:Lipopolysaccharide core n=1 Tax=Carex littledalei TaxID=544730 RepID=A0A833VPH8_9POAL|nr:Lipopolysaccharide core [Carex littledalei]
MARPPSSSLSNGRIPLHTRRFLLIAFVISVSLTLGFFLCRSACCNPSATSDASIQQNSLPKQLLVRAGADRSGNPLEFMRSKLVLLVSHELSLSGGPLLLMELAFLLRGVSSKVVWITYPKTDEANDVTNRLEHKMLNHGVELINAKSQEAIDMALRSDLVILNTAVAGKWLDGVLKEKVHQVLPKVLWWIHEMRGHYFKLEYVKHLPYVAGAMIDSYVTAAYWKNRTRERLKAYEYGLHLILSQCVSRGKGQDLFLQAFYQMLQIIKSQKIKVPPLHAIIVGSDMNAQTKFELELRNFVSKKGIQDRVHFVNKTMNVTPYLAAIDVLVQNSQARGECFGRITIEAMAFHLPVLGTAAGGTTEIVVNGTTGLLHPAGKEGIMPLVKNMVDLATHVERRVRMGRKGYERVKERFMEHHMADRIADVLKQVLETSKELSHS